MVGIQSYSVNRLTCASQHMHALSLLLRNIGHHVRSDMSKKKLRVTLVGMHYQSMPFDAYEVTAPTD